MSRRACSSVRPLLAPMSRQRPRQQSMVEKRADVLLADGLASGRANDRGAIPKCNAVRGLHSSTALAQRSYEKKRTYVDDNAARYGPSLTHKYRFMRALARDAAARLSCSWMARRTRDRRARPSCDSDSFASDASRREAPARGQEDGRGRADEVAHDSQLQRICNLLGAVTRRRWYAAPLSPSNIALVRIRVRTNRRHSPSVN